LYISTVCIVEGANGPLVQHLHRLRNPVIPNWLVTTDSISLQRVMLALEGE
jgi:hypothetical protein